MAPNYLKFGDIKPHPVKPEYNALPTGQQAAWEHLCNAVHGGQRAAERRGAGAAEPGDVQLRVAAPPPQELSQG